MFVLKNAWSSIVRRKWRTLLTMFIAIIVTFGTLFGFSVLHADESATDGYNPQLVSAVIRPDAAADSPERQLYDWLDTEAGQACIKKAGYVPAGSAAANG